MSVLHNHGCFPRTCCSTTTCTEHLTFCKNYPSGGATVKMEDLLRLGGELNSTGTINGQDLEDYFNVILDAFAIHIDREAIRHGLWKQYPAGDQINQIKIKVDRVLRSLERMAADGDVATDTLADNAVEELLDIINYANFAVRILRGRVDVS